MMRKEWLQETRGNKKETKEVEQQDGQIEDGKM